MKISYKSLTIDQDWKIKRREDPRQEEKEVEFTLEDEESCEEAFNPFYDFINDIFFNYVFLSYQYDSVELFYEFFIQKFTFYKWERLFEGDITLLNEIREEPKYIELLEEVEEKKSKKKKLDDFVTEIYKRIKVEEIEEEDIEAVLTDEDKTKLLDLFKLNSYMTTDYIAYLELDFEQREEYDARNEGVTEKDWERIQERMEENIDVFFTQFFYLIKRGVQNWYESEHEEGTNIDSTLYAKLQKNSKKLTYKYKTNKNDEIYKEGSISIEL